MLHCWIITVLSALAWAGSPTQSFDLQSGISSDGMVHANDLVLDRMFTNKRNYSVAILLTAEDNKYGCHFCKILGPDFREVAANYYRDHKENPDLVFVLADLDYCRGAFQQLGLTTAPNLFFYEPTSHPQALRQRLNAPHEQLSFASAGKQVGYLTNYLRKKGFDVKIVTPVRYDRISKFFGTLGLVAVATYVFWAKIKEVYQSKKIWLAASMVMIFLFVSGHMFNVTRHTPFIGSDKGQPQYFQRGHNIQYGIETQIIAVMYAILAFSTVLLITRVPDTSNKQSQLVLGLLVNAVVFVGFSVFIGFFKIKNGGYPYSLINFRF